MEKGRTFLSANSRQYQAFDFTNESAFSKIDDDKTRMLLKPDDNDS